MLCGLSVPLDRSLSPFLARVIYWRWCVSSYFIGWWGNTWLYSWTWCPNVLPLVKLHALDGSVVPVGVTVVTPRFKAKTRCSSYVCPGSCCHTYGQNVNTENQCLYYIVSYYKYLLQVQKGLSSRKDTILPQVNDRGFGMPRRSLHWSIPYLQSSRA
jgi:hypothetical protein